MGERTEHQEPPLPWEEGREAEEQRRADAARQARHAAAERQARGEPTPPVRRVDNGRA